MASLQRGNTELFYTTWGTQGEWITLLNGFMRSSSDFTLLATGLARAGFRVLALDNRGTGRTQYATNFTLDDMTDDVVAIWDQEEILSSHVIGFSMGGLLAQLLATRKNERISSLTLVSSCVHPARILRPNVTWSMDVDHNQAILGHYVSASFKEKNQMLLRMMAQAISTAVEKNDFLLHANRQLEAMRLYAPPTAAQRSAFTGSVLILHGREDALIPLEEAQQLQAAFPQSQFLVAEEAGHLLLAEKSVWLSATIISSLPKRV